MNLKTILHAIDELPDNEVAQIRQHLENRQREYRRQLKPSEDVEARIAALHATVADFREGLSIEELKQIAWAMNTKTITPKDLAEVNDMDAMVEALSQDEA